MDGTVPGIDTEEGQALCSTNLAGGCFVTLASPDVTVQAILHHIRTPNSFGLQYVSLLVSHNILQ